MQGACRFVLHLVSIRCTVHAMTLGLGFVSMASCSARNREALRSPRGNPLRKTVQHTDMSNQEGTTLKTYELSRSGSQFAETTQSWRMTVEKASLPRSREAFSERVRTSLVRQPIVNTLFTEEFSQRDLYVQQAGRIDKGIFSLRASRSTPDLRRNSSANTEAFCVKGYPMECITVLSEPCSFLISRS